MKVAILQSSYIPWKGYFDLIHDVDRFVFYDDVQYTRRDWRSRNRLKSVQGSAWLSVPTFGDRSQLICEVRFADPGWQDTHWKTITHCYGRARHFKRYRDFVADIYLGRRWETLSEFNQESTRRVGREVLGIETEFQDSRAYGAEGAKRNRIMDLVRKTGATTYISGPAARDYLDEAEFRAIGVELVWKDYSGYPEYPQLSAPFEHAVSILDVVFNVGPDAPWYIWGWRDPSMPRPVR
jgi:hypothetical protein